MRQHLRSFFSLPLLISFFISIIFSHISYAQNSTYDRINKEGTLIVGMSGEQPPFNFVSNTDMIVGYDVELATILGEALKVKVVIELMPFDQLMNALSKQKIDIIISGFSFSEERSKKITFIGPYALSGKSLLITKEKLEDIKGTTGFNHKSVHLMALENSTSKDLAKDRLNKAKLTTIKHYEDALLALRSGEADALVADLAICELAVIRDTNQQLTTLPKPLAVEEIGIAINKNEPLLADKLSEQLRNLTKSNSLKQLHDKWFSNPAWLEFLP
ncbi:hypothetical protein CW745_15860 [Psychromonas sp. psych-6C06]|uniref:substrate-binding periplasmic protein n=1 Tax=Psychromonas sp. psych-6C06 TaxID=2058089 RepID=UPI000C32BDF8|nr:transporter substrate-binding domain-containing protein [Psychromonas sp. psych-6C06]PKF60319.1 hypothetical protein CW745_15860 [Psychromonas sp. psych-6C06]